MRSITAVEMFHIWDRAYALRPARRALELLRAAYPGELPETLAALSVGSRDARLLTLRELFFGSRMACRVSCPRCSEEIESSFQVRNIRVAQVESASTHKDVFDGCAVTFRLPDSTDLELLERRQQELQRDPLACRRLLLARCILAGPDILSERAEAALVLRMGELDPQADIHLTLDCPACKHRCSAVFDIGGFLWQEINAWARRMLREVHALAHAYGWSEAEILSMSAVRRAMYLEMVQS